MRLLALALLLLALLPAQEKKVFYYPKPVARTAYQPPMKPVIPAGRPQGQASGQDQLA